MFGASLKGCDDVLLNDCLEGGCLEGVCLEGGLDLSSNIVDVLFRFRRLKYAVSVKASKAVFQSE